MLGGKARRWHRRPPKYIGDRRLVEIAVATLATDRALLLLGVPGTAKTWLSEHLAAAISGDSTLLVQGTAGTGEEAIRYGWNYALLLAQGPSRDALVPSPVMRGMETGAIVRVEELTRIPSDVQDALITILSEKTLPIPELGEEVQARKGFNVIATANNRDRGVNELSSALQRRFNTVVLPLPSTARRGDRRSSGTRVAELGRALELPAEPPARRGDPPDRHDLPRAARRRDRGRQDQAQEPVGDALDRRGDRGRQPGAGARVVLRQRQLGPRDVAAGLIGAIVRDPVQDSVIWREYLETVMKHRSDYGDLYKACREAERVTTSSRTGARVAGACVADIAARADLRLLLRCRWLHQQVTGKATLEPGPCLAHAAVATPIRAPATATRAYDVAKRCQERHRAATGVVFATPVAAPLGPPATNGRHRPRADAEWPFHLDGCRGPTGERIRIGQSATCLLLGSPAGESDRRIA